MCTYSRGFPISFFLLSLSRRRSKRGGPGWFLGHSKPKSKVAVCAVVTLLCGVSLLSSGLSAAFHAYSKGALSAIGRLSVVAHGLELGAT